MPSSDATRAQGPAEPDRRASARRRRRHRRARPDRRRARDDPGGRARSARRRRHGWSPGTAPRRRPWSRSAPSSTCSGRSSPAARSSRPRWPGRPATSSRCRSTTSWPAGRGSPRSCPTAARPIAPRVAEILGAELGWGEARQALEVETYLASARREFSVAPPDAREPPRGTSARCRRRPRARRGGSHVLARQPKVRAMASASKPRTIPPANAMETSVAENVARRNSDSSHG